MNNKAISLQQLANHLNSYLEIHKFQEKSYNGVQVATTVSITKIITAVSASKEIIERAVAEKAQAIIVHHGIFCKEDKHPLQGILYEKIKLLMDHNIALLGYHLPLDTHQHIGNNWKAACDLGLQNLKPALEMFGTHMAVIGQVESCRFEDFVDRVEKYYQRPAHVVKVLEHVHNVVIFSGGADKYIKEASFAGADCFITGRADEPVYDDAREYNISYIGVGHYGSETVGVQALAEYIQETLGVQAIFCKTNNPF